MILLETSAFVENFREKGRKDIKARVAAALLSGAAVLCEPVLLELWSGAVGKKDSSLLKDFEETLPVLECNQAIWQLSKKYAVLFRSKGLTVTNMDLLIFTIAVYHGASIIAVDRAFAKMRDALKEST